MKKLYAIFILLSAFDGIAQSFINPSLENWGVSTACEVNITPDSWNNYTNGTSSGLDEANFSFCPTTIPTSASNGICYARAFAGTQTSGEGMSQNVSGLIAGIEYFISFDYAGSNLYPGTNDIQWHIFIDYSDIDQTPVFNSNDSIWTTHLFSFTATATTHKIGFRAYTVTNVSTGSAAIDNFVFISSTAIDNLFSNLDISIFPVPVSEILNISTSSNDHFEFILFDISGRTILSADFRSSMSLNLVQLLKGIYFYEIRNKGFVIKKGKVLKD